MLQKNTLVKVFCVFTVIARKDLPYIPQGSRVDVFEVKETTSGSLVYKIKSRWYFSKHFVIEAFL